MSVRTKLLRWSVAVWLAGLVLVGLSAAGAGAQCNPTCPGDFNGDGTVTVDELVKGVQSALRGCTVSAEEQGCTDSGGTVTTELCCADAPDFPDTCSIGSCGCAPTSSRHVPYCSCEPGFCFDRTQRACVAIGG